MLSDTNFKYLPLLSSFTYEFAPVPSEIMNFWKAKNVDLMILENKLKTATQ